MSSFSVLRRTSAYVSMLLAVVGLLAATGCSSSVNFHIDTIALHKAETDEKKFTHAEKQELQNALTVMFGTPDAPNFPQFDDPSVASVVDLSKVRASAGKVETDPNDPSRRLGLYREHCAHCHGVTGDGRGPTAEFLNPYPRDYRMGKFKFHSNPDKNGAPTHDDLKRIIENGAPGSAMPSFRLLAEDEIESLTHYVKYLAIRGQTERVLIGKLASDGPKSLLSGIDASEAEVKALESEVKKVTLKWANAASTPVNGNPRPEAGTDEWKKSVNTGRELFYNAAKGNCVSCHGDLAMGDGKLDDYDDWTKELTPGTEDADLYVASHGAYPIRNIRPRNLRLGVYRGGRRPVDLYWRIANGIGGTPMPGGRASLTEEEIWNVIDYVRSIPYEASSRPPQSQEVNHDHKAS